MRDAQIQNVAKELRPLFRLAMRQGWRVVRNKDANHLRWISPTGRVVFSSGAHINRHNDLTVIRGDLKRAGLRLEEEIRSSPETKEPVVNSNGEAVTSLGEAIKEAQQRAEATPAPTASKPPVVDDRDTRTIVLEILKKHGPASVWVAEDLISQVHKTGKNVGGAAVYLALRNLWKDGLVSKLGRGTYRLAAAGTVGTSPKPVTHAAGQSSGDPQMDEDLAKLDHALVALADLEGVIRRNREVLHQLAELKRLLGMPK